MTIEDFIVPASPTLKNISDLDLEIVSERFLRDGVLLFRGFESSVDDFYRLANRFSVHLLVDPGQERTGGSLYDEIQSVTAGNTAINFHREYGQGILNPDLIMFYCERPALTDGQTTLADGVEVWDRLSEESKAILGKTNIKYYNRHPLQGYLEYFGIPYEHGWEDELRATLGLFGEFELKLLPDALDLTHAEYPVVMHDGCRRPCFVSSCMPGVYNLLSCALASGGPLPAELVSDITNAMLSRAVDVDWKANDVLVIDNARWFHARRSFQGNERKILNAVGYSAFRGLPPDNFSKISRISRAGRK